jgi:hypothetical protein
MCSSELNAISLRRSQLAESFNRRREKMRRMSSGFVLSFVFAWMQGCAHNESAPTLLRTGAALVCHAPALLLSSRPDGAFALNAGVFDSAQLVAAACLQPSAIASSVR